MAAAGAGAGGGGAAAPAPLAEDWPLALVRKNLAAFDALSDAEKLGRRPFVLVSTGALNPVHRGHVDMLVRARRCLEAQAGAVVVGGFVSPSHDGYVGPKCRRFGTLHLDAPLRLRLASLSVAGSDWLAAPGWECSPARRSWPDFGPVVEALQGALAADAAAAGLPAAAAPLVAYVCGEDHWDKCGRFTLSPAAVVVVPRASGSGPRVGPLPSSVPARLIYVVDEANTSVEELSSTKIRAIIAIGGPELATELKVPMPDAAAEALAAHLSAGGRAPPK